MLAMSDREEQLSEALRGSIRRIDRGLSGVEAAYLSFASVLGIQDRRCRAVLVFNRLKINFEFKAPPRSEKVEVNLDARPLHDKVEGDVDEARHLIRLKLNVGGGTGEDGA